MNLKTAQTIGKISIKNSKMPGSSFAIDSFQCKTGNLLALKSNSVCAQCYAKRVQKMRPNVDKGYKSNLDLYNSTPSKDWVDGIVYQLKHYSMRYHRWFDSGDLQSKQMFLDIVEVCKQTPNIKHWLPTREIKFIDFSIIPENLIVRISSPFIDDKPLAKFANTSTVFRNNPQGYACPAKSQNNNCGLCRACWDKSIPNVCYPKH